MLKPSVFLPCSEQGTRDRSPKPEDPLLTDTHLEAPGGVTGSLSAETGWPDSPVVGGGPTACECQLTHDVARGNQRLPSPHPWNVCSAHHSPSRRCRKVKVLRNKVLLRLSQLNA